MITHLTTRGRSFLAAGVTIAASGIVLGERNLVQIGLLGIVVPLLALVLGGRRARNLRLTRELGATRVERGSTLRLTLTWETVGPSSADVLLIEDQLPAALGPGPRFIPERGRRRLRSLEYSLHPQKRGRFQVGPARIRVLDGLGMVDRSWEHHDTDSLLVTPRTVPLPAIPLPGAWAVNGEARARDFVTGDAPDITLREYRQGDDLRKIHWPSTARVGDLMVRRDEQLTQARATVLLDNRERAHRGSGEHSSLETAVETTASVIAHLAGLGFQVRLVTADGEAVPCWHEGAAASDVAPHLEHLALLRTSRTPHLDRGWLADQHSGSLLVAVLGRLHDQDRATLSALSTKGTHSQALVLEADEWAPGSAASPSPASVTAAWLRSRGWRAGVLPRNASLLTVWQGLAR